MRDSTDADRLAAPAEDGAVLVWPEADAILRDVERNRQRRRSQRWTLLGGSVTPAHDRDTAPVIMTGHQPGFLHPGVWVKTVAATRLAARLGGRAEFLVVDNDAPGDLALSWPETTPDRWHVRRCVAVANPNGRSFEQLDVTTLAHWQAFFAGIPDSIRRSADRPLSAFESGFLSTPPTSDPDHLDYTDQWIRAMRAMDACLETTSPIYNRVGQFFSTENAARPVSPAVFIAHVLLSAERFAKAYNAALNAYRQRRGIRGTRHPIPDLETDGDRAELPFWLSHGPAPRRRLAVSRSGPDSICVWSDDEALATLGASELRNEPQSTLTNGLAGCPIRPRALTLTMYARVFACDLFIHGIGGAKYDQITDDIIRRFFGVAPPAYACVSATARLPLPRHHVTQNDLCAALARIRDIRFNPQRHLPQEDPSSQVRQALAARSQAIAEGHRLRAEEPRNHAARRASFRKIRAANASFSRVAPHILDVAHRKVSEVRRQLDRDRIAERRDWFVGLYPKAPLQKLCRQLPFA
ncbi:MAG: hypothetical protein ACE5F9_07670 [Phycisphaerae bacterium]